MKKTRQQELALLKELKIKQKLGLHEAMALLHISESTARRLFIRVEASGTALRSHGGICLLGDATYAYDEVAGRQVAQKEAIAHKAIALLQSGDTIFIDSGTTMAHFCTALAEVLERGALTDVVIFTNSLVNLHILQRFAVVNLVGGEYRVNRKDFCGYLAEEAVKKLHFTKCFLGTDGYGAQVGFTATDFLTARLNELVMQNASQCIVLADSAKLGKPSVVSYSTLRAADILVTDTGVAEATKTALQKDGTVILVSKMNETFKNNK